ncbi:MAG: hypothetical protein RSE00_05205 [Clostridia bacterium]
MYSDCFDLKNNFKVCKIDEFPNKVCYDVLWKDKIIEENCDNFSIVNGKILVIQKDKSLKIFSINPKNTQKSTDLKMLGEFILYSPNAMANIQFEDYYYVIDSNCHITYTYRKKAE